MTRKNLSYLLSGIVLLAIIIFWQQDEMGSFLSPPPSSKTKADPSSPKTTPEISSDEAGENFLEPSENTDPPESIEDASIPPKVTVEPWEKELQASFYAQGGTDLKSVQLQKEKVVSWNDNGRKIQAQTTLVTLKNQKDEITTFRVLVDPATGRILQNWDQPVRDPVDPSQNFGIKLDKRHLQD